MRRSYAAIFALFLAGPAFGMGKAPGFAVPPAIRELNELIREGRGKPTHAAAIEAVSAKLLGRPYKLGASGEGKFDAYDQDPLWRLDVFDCTTYVETVMAAVNARNPRGFERALYSVRYLHGRVSFVTRNHFPEADWIPRNESAGNIRDVTRELFPDLARPTSIVISKARWYGAKTANDIEPRERDINERERLAAELRALAPGYSDEPVTLFYLPMQSFYVKHPENGTLEPNLEVLRKVPSGAIFNIVREGWMPGGHPLAISHQGFLVQKPDGLYMRHASVNKQVMEDRIDEYFRRFLESPTVRGINILVALPASK